jgi:hypothetical protein
MTVEYFTRLARCSVSVSIISFDENLVANAVVVMSPEGAKSGVNTPQSVSHVMAMQTDDFLAFVAEVGFEERPSSAWCALQRLSLLIADDILT